MLIDCRQPMSYTSAQSGDNYRNWWPHPTMTAFTNDSIDQMTRLAHDTGNVFNMTERGYVLATRRQDAVVPNTQSDIDLEVVTDPKQIRARFPALSEEIRSVIHVKRGGDFASQQLSAWMLERFRENGGKRMHGEVFEITHDGVFSMQVITADETKTVRSDVVINAAGPFANAVAQMLGETLPIKNIYQQKIAFDDHFAAIPRNMPFSIDLDEKTLGWSDEEHAMLASDPQLQGLTRTMPAGTHCRPDGSEQGTRVKLGWAYNAVESPPQRDLANEAAIDPHFPEIVIRGATALIPSLRPYVDAPPTRFAHYGGYYTMTEENWPLIGSMGPPGSFVVGALSGFGSMSACAAGRLCATTICGGELPAYANELSLRRYENRKLINELQGSPDKGLL